LRNDAATSVDEVLARPIEEHVLLLPDCGQERLVVAEVGDPPAKDQKEQLGSSGPNLEPGTMRVYVTNGPRDRLNIGRRVNPYSEFSL